MKSKFYTLSDKFDITPIKVNKLSFGTMRKIKKEVKNLDFDDLTIAPNLKDPLRFYDIRFYKGNKLQLKIVMADYRLYDLTNARARLKAYLIK